MAPCSSWSATPGIENLTRLRARGHSQRYMYLRNLPGGKVRAKLRSWASFPLLVFAVRHIQRPLRLADCRRRRVSTRPLFPANKQSRYSQTSIKPGRFRSSNLPVKCLVFYQVLVKSVFSGLYLENIAYIADSKRAEGGGYRRFSTFRRKNGKANGQSSSCLFLVAYCLLLAASC
jgi:hypothetical protein